MTKIQAMICIYNLSSSLTQEDKQALQIILDEIVVLNDRLGVKIHHRFRDGVFCCLYSYFTQRLFNSKL